MRRLQYQPLQPGIPPWPTSGTKQDLWKHPAPILNCGPNWDKHPSHGLYTDQRRDFRTLANIRQEFPFQEATRHTASDCNKQPASCVSVGSRSGITLLWSDVDDFFSKKPIGKDQMSVTTLK